MRRAYRRLLTIALGCLTVTAIAGCGEGAPSTPTASSGGATVGTAGVNLGAPAVKVAATDQLQFSPSTVTARVGDIVQWTNTGTVAHTVTFDSQPSLTDASLAPSATWEVKFTKAGTYPYRCTIHPGMNGTLVVR